VTLDRLLDEYLAHVRTERGYSAHTVAAYRADLLDLIRFANERGVADAAGIDLALLRDWLWAATERDSHARASPGARHPPAASRRGCIDAS
jgi:integrase/recombinase XerC